MEQVEIAETVNVNVEDAIIDDAVSLDSGMKYVCSTCKKVYKHPKNNTPSQPPE